MEYKFLKKCTMEIPNGWINLVSALCEEIQNVINEKNLEDYEVCQVKEKFGELRWYDWGGSPEIDEIIEKYRRKSQQTCASCGKPATKISLGWICPWCDDCAKLINDKFRNIEEDNL